MSDAQELARGEFSAIGLGDYGLPDHVLKPGPFVLEQMGEEQARLRVNPNQPTQSQIEFSCDGLYMFDGLEGEVARDGVLTLTTDAFKAAALAYFWCGFEKP